MRNYLIAGLVGALLGALTSAPLDDRLAPEPVEIFYGTLERLDGRTLPDFSSRVSLSVTAIQGASTPWSYRLYVDCEDHGLRLTPPGAPQGTARRWYSFSGTAGAATDSPNDLRQLLQCRPEDPERYNRIVTIMTEPGSLTLSPNHAELHSADGEARFRIAPRPQH